MTNEEIIQAIKTEIEMLKAKYRKDMYKSNHEGLASGYKIEAYNELLSFLSTLESEKPISEELEEASSKFATYTAPNGVLVEFLVEKLSFQEGAKWQKEQDDKELSEKIAGSYQLGLSDKEKMIMKETVEGIAHPDDCEIWVDLIGYGFNIKDGDKVRVIVLPKEDGHDTRRKE